MNPIYFLVNLYLNVIIYLFLKNVKLEFLNIFLLFLTEF